MIDFKAKNAASIAKAKEGPEAKIAGELAALTSKEEGDKGEWEDTQVNKKAETSVVSSSNTVPSWLYDLMIIDKTLGVRALI